MNNYSTIGRLTKDPETKFTPTGKAVTSFDIAVDVGFGQNKKTIFWPCKIWGERGETLAKYVAKGHQVGIEAGIDQEEWTDKTTGEPRKKLVLNVRDFTLLSNGERQQSQQRQAQQPRREPPPPARYQGGADAQEYADGGEFDEIPF